MSQQALLAPCASALPVRGFCNSASSASLNTPSPHLSDPMAQALARVVSHYIEACRRL